MSVFGTFELGVDRLNDSRCFMFGVHEGMLHRYTYFVNLEDKTVLLEEEI